MNRQPDGVVNGLRFFERPVDESERSINVIRRAECRPPRTNAVPPYHVRVVCLMVDGTVRCSCGQWGCEEEIAAQLYFNSPPNLDGRSGAVA